MRREPCTNGDDGDDSSSSSEGGAGAEAEELSLTDAAAPARALAALNALRKSRQHYDVVLVAGGAEVAAHRAVLAAASPYLLEALGAAGGARHYRVEDVDAAALRALVEYAYTGRLAARDAAAARALYRAAWRLRVEPARAHLAARLLRRLAPAAALPLRALPDLAPHHLAAVDAFISDNFEEVCESGALAALPQINIEMLRESSASGGADSPPAVAEAALAWLRAQEGAGVAELSARTHLLYVGARGELRDCGELPPARGDAPELQQYRREGAAARRDPAPAPAPALPGLELGARAARAECAVLCARRAPGAGGGARALVALHGALAALRVAWSDAAAGGGGVARGAALGGEAGGARLAALAAARCAHGAAALGGRLVVCGGYDRARALRSAEAYCPAENAWAPLADMPGARARFAAARLGGRVWALGGSDGHAELDSADAYSEGAGGAGGGWRRAARLPAAVAHAAAAADEAGGALFVVGGWAAGGILRRVVRYSPAEDAWSEAPPLRTGRAQCAGVVWEGALWALGGCDAWHCLASTERLPLREEGAAWAAGPALPTARRSVGGCVWRGRLVSAGGSDGAASLRRTEWLAAEDAGAARAGAAGWRAGPALRRPRAGLALAELAGALYAVGGFDGKEFLSCVECLYEPDTEWTALCDPARPARALATVAGEGEGEETAPAPADH